MKIGLKAGERLFLNGAVIRADQKTTIELMNDAVFLLESHIMQRDEATTPLRQLYFVLQSMVMDPASSASVQGLASNMAANVGRQADSRSLQQGMTAVDGLISSGRWYEAMKVTRSLYDEETPKTAGQTKRAPQAA